MAWSADGGPVQLSRAWQRAGTRVRAASATETGTGRVVTVCNQPLIDMILLQIGRVQRQPRNADKSADADGSKGPNGPLQREAFIAALVGVSATLGMDVLCSKVSKLHFCCLACLPCACVALVCCAGAEEAFRVHWAAPALVARTCHCEFIASTRMGASCNGGEYRSRAVLPVSI